MNLLEKTDIEKLTNKKRAPAQCRVLNAMGITYIIRPDGQPVVSGEHVQKILDGQPQTKQREKTRVNLKGING